MARRWAALYGQVLAAASELHEAGATGAEDAGSMAATTTSSTISTAMDIRFPSLGIPASDGAAAAALPASPAAVRTYEAARPLFLQASRQLEAAKAYFKLEGFVTDHAHLQRELSRLYRHLSSFEAVRPMPAVVDGVVVAVLFVGRFRCGVGSRIRQRL